MPFGGARPAKVGQLQGYLPQRSELLTPNPVLFWNRARCGTFCLGQAEIRRDGPCPAPSTSAPAAILSRGFRAPSPPI